MPGNDTLSPTLADLGGSTNSTWERKPSVKLVQQKITQQRFDLNNLAEFFQIKKTLFYAHIFHQIYCVFQQMKKQNEKMHP